MTPPKPLNRVFVMIALVTAGEAVFLLPFMIGRIFRTTLLDVFQISNTELGVAYSTYGFVAIGAYFVGGPLADRFSARRLMAAALTTTAAGGAVFASSRSLLILQVLYAFWGVTTILLFWAALIRATREWGGATGQGRAYGILDGGRGLVAAAFATLALTAFTSMLPVDVQSATLAQRGAALEMVIWLVAAFTLAAALLVLLLIPKTSPSASDSKAPSLERRLTLRGVLAVMRMPAIWLQAVIIVCAYVGYKSIDNVGLYARDVFGYDDVQAAQLGTLAFWVRPLAAVAAGFLSDRWQASRVAVGGFALFIAGNATLALGVIPPGATWILAMTLVVSCVGVNALRGVYFALFNEARVPLAFTGSAVGLISVIGYLPDIFMGPLMGHLTDSGQAGHYQLYAVIAGFGAVGLLTTILFRRITTRQWTTHANPTPQGL